MDSGNWILRNAFYSITGTEYVELTSVEDTSEAMEHTRVPVLVCDRRGKGGVRYEESILVDSSLERDDI